MSMNRNMKLKLASFVLILALVFTFILTMASLPVSAYVTSLGNVLYWSVNGDAIILTIDNGNEPGDDILEITVLQDNIFTVNYRPNGIQTSQDTPMIDPDKTWGSVGANFDTGGNPIVVTTSDIYLEIHQYPCRITVKDSNGTPLFWEPASGGIFYNGVRFVRASGQNLYGIRSYNCFEDHGDILRNDSSHAAHAGEQGDAGGPFVWSTSGYGILVDGDGGYPFTETATGKIEYYYGGLPPEGRRYSKSSVKYYVIMGDAGDIMAGLNEITGRPPMMPKWSLGFSNFEWNTNQLEMIQMVNTYRAKNIPLDSYGLDYDWKRYGEDNYGEFRWNTVNFPDSASTAYKEFMDEKGIKMIGICKPRIVVRDFNNQPTQQGIDAENGGYWYPGHYEYSDYFIPVTVRSIDPYNADCRDWWWENSEDAFNRGIVGWWNDETDKVSSGQAQNWFGNFTTTHLSQAMYEGQRAYTNDSVRVWQTARTFYPGAQRYATTLWSGDIGIQFYKGEKIGWAAGLKEQRPVLLSSVNLGQPKWGMDTGGFNQQDGTTENPSPELYTRWMQFGAVTPVFRVHGNNYHQRQPWFYGTTAEEISKSYIHLRYSLMPYLYAYERTTYEQGIGLVRPLIFNWPDDQIVKNSIDAWMFGDWLLAAPVVDRAQTMKDIYLPAGTWIDYFTGAVYEGSQTIRYSLDAESWTDLPLFIKKGAIIPTQRVLDYVEQSDITEVFIDVFADLSQSSFLYYDDNGESYDYELGEYVKQTMTTVDNGGNGINFTIYPRIGNYTAPLQHYIVKIHGKAGTNVTLNSSPLPEYTDLNTLKALSGEGWVRGRDIYGEVTYVKVAALSTGIKSIQVSGNSYTGLNYYKYEAEEASLWGTTVQSKASVNNNHGGYSGLGFVDGFHQDGAAVTFYPKVKAGGDYEVGLRYANATGSEKRISIYVNGKRIKQTILPSLANWSTWTVKTETLPLSAGHNVVTYKYEEASGDTGNVNLDYITIPFYPSVGKYEAESAALSGGAAVNRNHWFYSGTGFVDGMTSIGATAKFTVDVPSAGNYRVVLKYANGMGNTRTLNTYVNDVYAATVNLPSPGLSWSVWSDNEQVLSLEQGVNSISYRVDSSNSGHVNLDRILVATSTPGMIESEKNLLDNGSFERAPNYSNNWTEWRPWGQEPAFGIDSGSGLNPPESPYEGDKRAYFWHGQSYKQSIQQVVAVPQNNANYRFEARVRLKNTTPYTARAEISMHGGSQVNYNLTNDGQWHYISIDNIYVTTGEVKVGFYIDSPGGTTLHIDDVRLYLQ